MEQTKIFVLYVVVAKEVVHLPIADLSLLEESCSFRHSLDDGHVRLLLCWSVTEVGRWCDLDATSDCILRWLISKKMMIYAMFCGCCCCCWERERERVCKRGVEKQRVLSSSCVADHRRSIELEQRAQPSLSLGGDDNQRGLGGRRAAAGRSKRAHDGGWRVEVPGLNLVGAGHLPLSQLHPSPTTVPI